MEVQGTFDVYWSHWGCVLIKRLSIFPCNYRPFTFHPLRTVYFISPFINWIALLLPACFFFQYIVWATYQLSNLQLAKIFFLPVCTLSPYMILTISFAIRRLWISWDPICQSLALYPEQMEPWLEISCLVLRLDMFS